MRTIHALFAFVLVFSIVAMSRQLALAEQEPPKGTAAGKPCAEEAVGEKVVEIPLKKIWANDMPGTVDVRELEPESFRKPDSSVSLEAYVDMRSKTFTSRIRSALGGRHDEHLLGNGFVVEGIGREALKRIAEELSKRVYPEKAKQLLDKLPAEVPLSLFFYTRPSGSYVQLKKMLREGNQFTIEFSFVPKSTMSVKEPFALISLGKLVPGTYHVVFKHTKVLKTTPHARVIEKMLEGRDEMVCRSFTFVVVASTHD